jgi:hypothetical protein
MPEPQSASARLNERVGQGDGHHEGRAVMVAEQTVQRQSSEKLHGLSAHTVNTEKGEQASLKDDDGKATEIRDKLKKKGGYPKDILDEMMVIERQMAATLVAFNSQEIDDLVLEIEMRWLLVETMKLVDKYLKEGSFQFPDQDTGYMISRSYWKPLSEPFEPRQGGTALVGEHGYTRNIFRPDYNSLAIRPTAAEAVDAIFTKSRNNPIVLDCNAMMVAMQYRAMKIAFKAENFNKMFPENRQGLYIGPVGDPEQKVYPDYKSSDEMGTKGHPFLELGLYTEKDYSPGYFNKEKVEKELVIGDWVYFQNHEDYKDFDPYGMWQGEHAVYVGDGKFMGAGLARKTGAANIFTYDEVLDELQEHYERVYNANKEKQKTKAKLTRDTLPGIVVRLVPNVKALKKLPKVTK